MKTAIIVSGGDAPGINTAIASFARLASQCGDQVLGAQGGFAGLLAERLAEIDQARLSLLRGRGGSVLQSSRDPALEQPSARQLLGDVMQRRKIDNLLVFGGDGTIRHVAPRLAEWGVSCIVLPTTIDNDVAGTDYTLGHDSACNFALNAVDGIRATAHALPGRIFLLETLGAPTGHLALAIAHASGAHLALLPEYPLEVNWLAQRLRDVVARDGYALVVASEAYPDLSQLVQTIPQLAGIRVRFSALGHAQRGADVSHWDRRIGRELSRIALRAFKQGPANGLVIMRDGALTLHAGSLPRRDKPPPDRALYEIVNQL